MFASALLVSKEGDITTHEVDDTLALVHSVSMIHLSDSDTLQQPQHRRPLILQGHYACPDFLPWLIQIFYYSEIF